MKKRNIILCAGVLSMAMLCGCESNNQTENTAKVTAEATQEVTDTETTLEVTEAVATPEATDAIIEDEGKETTAESNTVVEQDSEKTEIQEENTETADVDSQVTFSSLMTAIYEVDTSNIGAETVAEELKTYAFTNGEPSSSPIFEEMANDWFDTMKNAEGKDIRSEFRKCFDTVTTTAQKMDETLEYDVAYLNVINGISAAIGE